MKFMDQFKKVKSKISLKTVSPSKINFSDGIKSLELREIATPLTIGLMKIN